MIERCARAEPLFDHLPGGIVINLVSIGALRTAQVTAETGEPARLIVCVIYKTA
jgi:hypothetical protein